MGSYSPGPNSKNSHFLPKIQGQYFFHKHDWEWKQPGHLGEWFTLTQSCKENLHDIDKAVTMQTVHLPLSGLFLFS